MIKHNHNYNWQEIAMKSRLPEFHISRASRKKHL